MGLLSGLTKVFKKVVDSPLVRGVATAYGYGGVANAVHQQVSGNSARTAGIMGAGAGGSSDYNAFPIGTNMGLLNFNTTSMPGSGGVVSFPGGSWPTGGGSFGGSGATGSYAATPQITQTGNFPGAPVYKVLRNGKVRVGRLGRDGKAHFSRRMNPMNPRAARRAIKRIRSVRMITRAIEAELPRARARR